MGDVFDQIVSRTAVAPDRSPATGLTTRRRPVFGVPDASGAGAEDRASGSMDAGLREVEVERAAGESDHAVPQTRTVGSETRRDTGGSGRRPAGPRGPASPAIPPRPQVGGRGGEHEQQPESEPPTLGPDHRESDPVGPRPTQLDLSPQRAPRGVARSGPEQTATEVAAADATGPAPGPAPGEPPADAVAARADVAIGVEASDARTPDARPVRARRRPPRPDPMPTRTLPAEELLREHLAPALVDRGALDAQDAVRLTAVGLDPIGVPAGGDVHVHLGQVVVQQAPTPPAPEPPSAANRDAGRPDPVDHADYLARQRRRWS